jgi:phosphonate transport system permease protein
MNRNNEGKVRKAAVRRSLVPPSLAGVLSLVIPGLGQVLARAGGRGLLLFFSLVSSIGLLIWRMRLIARREEGVLAILRKAVDRQPVFVVLLLVGLFLLWLWIAWDAYRQAAEPERRGGSAIFFLVILLFFVLGWQISEINLYKAVTEIADAGPPLLRVLWPWPAAVTREKAVVSASAEILAPCDESPSPAPPVEVPGQPYIIADPTCGNLSELDENNQVVLGTTLHLRGWGFEPNTDTQIWWKDPLGNEFRVRQAGEYIHFLTDGEGTFDLDVIMPYRLIPPSAVGRQMHEVEARQSSEVGGLMPSEPLRLTIERMVETIFLGLMATLFGVVLAVPVSFIAARNLMSGSVVTLVLYYVTRTILNIVRSIEPLIWAIIAVIWVGLGPFAGIIALTLHSIAALGKLYSEAIEGIDPGPIEAIQATGANWLQTIMYAVVPQMIPPFVSFTIYRWDINVRMSTVIGLVGGGGIGFLLIQYIRLLDYRAAGIAVWFIAITVAVLDYISADIRQRFV